MSNITTNNQDIIYIDSDDKLLEFCEKIRTAQVLILDTEFIREKTYYAKLCLIQVCANELIACIDPLTINDLQPFMDIIFSPDKIKVLHAARQDYEIFHDINGQLPCPVFDTQLVASLLGYGDQIGYAGLVKKVLDVDIDKTQARTDWSARPLTAAQITYAADDVYYLNKIYPVLVKQLQEQQREDWLTDDFESLCQTSLYIVHPEDAWKKLKGANRLKPRQLAAAQELAKWREITAIKVNKPRRWILSDDILIIISQFLPKNKQELEKIRGLNKKDLDNKAGDILAAVNNALQMDESLLPKNKKAQRLSPEQEIVSDLLMTELRLLAEKNQISVTNLASRKDINKLTTGNNDIPLLKGWRHRIAGQHILDLLNGKTCLQITDREVKISDI